MTARRRIVRIFISSPGDVADERDKARRVIDGLQRQYSGVTLQPVLWEDLALPATASFQQSIDVLLNQQPIDIAVFILWSRLGSPLGAAITRPDGTPYRSGTEREFDLMLAAFEQSGKQRPVILAYSRDDENGFRQTLTDCPGTRLEELIAQRKLAESFIREQFYDEEGHNLRAVHSYREPVSFAQRLHTHLRPVLKELLGVDAAPRWMDEPYRGLAFFDVPHAAIFHGRDEETCDLLQRLRDQEQAGCAFAVVVGASGSGRGSLARAGVAAALIHHPYDEGVKEWRAVAFIPGLGGSDLCASLTSALAEQVPELRSSVTELDDISSGLIKDAALTVKLSIIPAFARAAEKARGTVKVLLILDQMEELWTDRRITAADREQFLNAIEALARSGHIAVLATLRSDFYPHAQLSPIFLRLKGERGHCDLLPPGTSALRRLITEPARLAGLSFECDERTRKTLDEVVLQDAACDPSALPLLEYALGELYHQRDEGTRKLTFAAYKKLGGVEGALGKRATDTFNSLPADARAALPEILPLLVTVDVAGEKKEVRRRAPLTDLTATPARRALTESLIAARFLTTDREGDAAIASLAHEALLRRWDQIAKWVKDNREHLRLRARVEQNQHRWEQQSRDSSLLLPPGLPLEEGRQLITATTELLLPATTTYIRTSIAYHEAEEARIRKRRRTVMAAMAVLTVLALVGGLISQMMNSKVKDLNKDLGRTNSELEKTNGQLGTAKEIAETQLKKTRIQLATNYFQHGLAEESAGRFDTMRRDLVRAWVLMSPDEPLRAAYERVLLDRLTTQSGRMTGPIFRHDNMVTAVAFSPDGARVATGSNHKTARLWDAHSGAPVGEPMQHDEAIFAVAFSPDSTRVVTSSTYFTARLWDARSGVPVGEPMPYSDKFRVAFSPDGTRLVTGSYTGVAQLRDAQSGAPVGKPMRHDGSINAVAFSPDGARLVTGSSDKTARQWDARSGAPLGEPMRHDDSINAVAFSPDSTRVATGSSDKTARLWDAHNSAPLGEPMRQDTSVTRVAFSPDGTRMATGSGDNIARLWDARNGAPRGEPMRHESWISDMAFSPDGTRVVTFSFDKKSSWLWDAHSGAPLGKPLQHDGWITAVAFSPDGTWVITGSRDSTARLWDAQRRAPLGEPMRHEDSISAVAFSPDGTRLVTGSRDKTARLWDARSGALLGVMRHYDFVGDVAFSPDGTRVVTGSFDHTARLWDAYSGAPLGEPMEHGHYYVLAVAFSPDGTRIVTRSDDGAARLWDARNGAPLVKPMRHEDSIINAVAFSPDGTRIVTGSDDGAARLWDARNGAPFGEPMRFDHSINAVAFSPDGTRIVTGSGNGSAWLWDARSGAPLGKPMRHDDKVTAVAFSPDGTRIVTRSDDRTARLWDARNGEPLGEPMRQELWMSDMAFSPDGTRLVTGSYFGKTAQLWDAHSGAPLGEPMDGGPISAVAFSPDGTRVVTGSGDNTARLWDVEPVPVPHHNLRAWIEFQSGFSGSEAEAFRKLTFDELEERLKLIGKDEDFFDRLKRGDEMRTRRILVSAAASAEEAKDWFAAAFHLDQLMHLEPENAQYLHRLGLALGWQDRWGAALEAFSGAVRLNPHDMSWKHDQALACLRANDLGQYPSLARNILEVAETSDEVDEWDKAVQLLALYMPGGVEASRIVALARRAVEKKPEEWFNHESFGASLFRAGEYATALSELNESLSLLQKNDTAKEHDKGSFPMHAFLALVYDKLGEHEPALLHRDKAFEIDETQPAEDWGERLRRQILKQELTTALGKPVNSKPKDKPPEGTP